MGAEVIQHKVIRVKVPDGKRVSRVRFLSDHPDCRPVEATWPWPHPWWCTGTYGKNGEEGCIIVAYTEDVDLLKKGWPEGRDFEIFDSGLEYYTYSVRYQPDDEFIKNKLPKVWGQWAHCGPNHKWQLIIREFRELLDDLLIDAKIEDVVSAALPAPDPKAEDFLIWWLSPKQVEVLHDRMRDGGLSDWPEYLRSEIGSLVGRNPKGQLWINPIHMDIVPKITDEYRGRIDDDKGGIVFLRRDLKFPRMFPGVISDFMINTLETHEAFPIGR